MVVVYDNETQTRLDASLSHWCSQYMDFRFGPPYLLITCIGLFLLPF